MTRLRLQQLTKRYPSVTALANISLTAEPGEFLAVVGPSGSGKSTLLRLIAGLEKPSSGEIFYNEEPISHLPPQARDIGMVFQTYALYPHMTVFENLAFPLRLRRWRREAIQDQVRQVARLLELQGLLERYPRELSGGQRQRVALGRALVRSPKLFLLDEPLSNIDAQLRATMRAELAALQQNLGITTLYVTHDQAEALSLGHRVAVLSSGHLLQVAPPSELYNRPVSVTVARFIGTPPMNLFAVTANSGALQLVGTESRLPSPLQLAEGSPWLLGARAEALALRPAEGWHPLGSAQVRTVEYAGHEMLVTLRHPAAVVPPVVRLSAGTPPPQPGASIPVFLNPDSWCLFASESGERIFPP
ncbi:MAG: ABC transporter ATP-binding protein [Candidatus Kapabacteria bacterium]|nr:ABC transporter ATP-binding protein [Candidatus Kapabacteria bacterium]MCS7169430.1 ABC transporter ATP-binding protein [Candidatus Kapabacteria bacterium]MDW7997470.1 ABC transporter ATP-binding protein [Bacteroidota bacterium]MDW8225014.1 ABC transporter ATP-binding protein [Bacteroidota bacterium]